MNETTPLSAFRCAIYPSTAARTNAELPRRSSIHLCEPIHAFAREDKSDEMTRFGDRERAKNLATHSSSHMFLFPFSYYRHCLIELHRPLLPARLHPTPRRVGPGVNGVRREWNPIMNRIIILTLCSTRQHPVFFTHHLFPTPGQYSPVVQVRFGCLRVVDVDPVAQSWGSARLFGRDAGCFCPFGYFRIGSTQLREL